MQKSLIIIAACASLSACSSFSSLKSIGDIVPFGVEKLTPFNNTYQAVGAIDVASVIVTDKTLIDHFVSYIEEEDCSSVRASIGDKYCRPHRIAYTPPPEPFCYRSLARASCFTSPNPYGTDTRMGSYLPGISGSE